MKTLGLIGGTSWASTIDYYRYINEGINEKSGGIDFARCIIYSFNFSEIKRLADAGSWDAILQMVTNASKHLVSSGAEAIILCANTMHYIADRLEKNINVPLIHITKETAKQIKKRNLKTVALLGTRFTMEFDFFKLKLAEQNIKTIVPDKADRDYIHSSIFDELGKNIIKPETKKRYIEMIDKLISSGAEGVILGCTEIPLLIKQEDLNIPAFDTTRIHSDAAVRFAMGL
jgi:aspartate racemase